MSEEERRREIARKHGVPLERITERVIINAGDIQTGVSKKPTPNAFEDVMTVEEVIEQRYTDSIERAAVMQKIGESSRYVLEELPELPKQKAPVYKKFKVSGYMSKENRLRRSALEVRPKDAPSILEECETPVKLHISQHQAPGDILMLTAAVRDLHIAYPGKFITNLHTPASAMWENNPYNTSLDADDPDAMWIVAKYPLIHKSNSKPYHFIHGFRKHLEQLLGLSIPAGDFKGDIHLSREELNEEPMLKQLFNIDKPFWIINAGHKTDFTTKMWEHARYQQVVADNPDITFVQVGEEDHIHKPLQGDNLYNAVGKTTLRQFIKLMYGAAGVITPVSLAMHLSSAVPVHPRYSRHSRPCIVIAGGREPASWEAYPTHQYLHTCGMLPCCNKGGCWKSRVEVLNDNDIKDNSLCTSVIKTDSGQNVPECLDMISASEVTEKIRKYTRAYGDLK